MASPNLSEIVTTTLRNRSGKLADNVTDNNAILRELSKRGKIMPFDGGRTIVQELEYAENGTYTRYSGYETLNIAPSDVFSAAEFDIKQASVAVSISGLEEIQNSGPNAIINLLTSRVANAERTMRNNMSADCYSDGTADGGKQVGGLQLLVADTPTSGTVGGINRANFTFWRNQTFDASTDGGGAMTSSNAQSYMNQLWLQCSRGTDKPNLILADNNYFRHYWESLQNIQRIQEVSRGAAGFTTLSYMGAPVIYDGGIDGACPTDHMYFLNCDYIHYRPYSGRNMVPIGDDRFSTNQDAMVRLVGWAGNMTLSNGQLQGVLKA